MSEIVPKVVLCNHSDFSANFEKVLHTLDEEFSRFSSRTLERFFFSFDGLDFDVRRVEQEKNSRFLITATIGYVPFSIESKERRDAIGSIIIGSRSLPKVRFGIDMSSKISAVALYDMPQIVFPHIVFSPLVLFLQEARPFINLIGKYLFEPSVIPSQKQNPAPTVEGS